MHPLMGFEHPWFSQNDEPRRRSTVLVVDDHESVRTYLRESLTEIYNVEVASNSQDGVRLAKQIVPDLIITALTTQAVDTESLCVHLKHCDNTNHIPIIILAETNDPSNRIKSFYFGADDCMALPLQQVELQVRIENLIQLRKTLQRKFSKHIELKAPSVELQSKDEIFLQRVMRVMESNMHNPLFGADQFALQMGFSPRHLSRKLVSLAGHSPNDFIRKIRLQRAADMLDKHAGKVREVASRVGFNNLSYFAKCFKEFHHCSPSDYARRVAS